MGKGPKKLLNPECLRTFLGAQKGKWLQKLIKPECLPIIFKEKSEEKLINPECLPIFLGDFEKEV